MEQLTQEITREYRLNYNKGEPEWDDPIPPEITFNVLGDRTGTAMNRASLLAWSLMSLPGVEAANMVGGSSIEIRLSTDAEFNELTFKFQVAELVANVREIRACRANATSGWRLRLWDLAAALLTARPRLINEPASRP
jgi:hypothetical protein